MMRWAVVVLAVIVLQVVTGAFFVVQEFEQAVKTQFGAPVGDAITEPGLHFKLPLVQQIHFFEKRFLEWDGKRNELPTKDKRFIWVDTYARWQITDPLLFFQRFRDENGAQSRLDDILNGETRNAIANHDLVELIRSSNRVPTAEGDGQGDGDTSPALDEISFGRERIRDEILTAAQSRTVGLGIEILDMQFKRINYVEEVRKKVYDRMIAERKRIADRFRSEGEGERARILGEMERELKKIESEAYRLAQEIVGTADAQASELYAQAYNQSADSRRFYDFLKSMETLEKTLDSDTWLLLSTDGELYRYLEDSDP